jgi:hypothetical protein
LRVVTAGGAMTFYAVEDIVPKHPADGVEVRIIHGERLTVAFLPSPADPGCPNMPTPTSRLAPC